ncbi:MAG: PQQ-binding-like beta-propeller repeat protein [Planctomycetales bacterium]|nr:PQQ-binding-like beta-propeller repeat protein [Planctomycetales bacterium]
MAICRPFPRHDARGVIHLAVCIFIASLWAIVANRVDAQDWPQTLGPDRDGQAPVKVEFAAWPSELKPTWTANLGSGYAGPAVSGNQALALHRTNRQEILTAIDLATGKTLWDCAWSTTFQPSYNPDGGPRCVPTIRDSGTAKAVAICYGAAGDLTCVRLSDGKLLWHRELRKEFEADDGYFGAGAAPLVMGDQIIVCLGGRNAGIVAVAAESGATRWSATNYEASYASPIAIRDSLALVVTRLHTVLVDVSSGQVRAEIPFGSRGPTVNASTPISVGDNRYLLTASYGVGATLLEIQNDTLTPIYRGKDLLASQYNTPVQLGSVVLGIHGREDVGVAALRAIDPIEQQILWEEPGFGTAHLIGVGKRALSLGIDGQLTLIDATAAGYRAQQEANLPKGLYRALPALIGKTLLVRSHDGNNGRLMRFDLP